MAVAAVSNSAYDLAGVSAAIDGIRVIDDPALVRLKSRDFFWYSPVLKDALNQKYADLVVCPCDEAEIIRVARAAARFRVPITPRGGGTGNYGQAVPLAGGILLDMTGLDAIEWARPGQIRVQAGRKLAGIDDALRGDGWELRMFPSTKRTATIGAFVAGGSGGRVTASGLPLISYTTPERLNEIIAAHEARGIMFANPHVFTLEDGTRYKRADADQLDFKRRSDPYRLLNRGKMRSFVPVG